MPNQNSPRFIIMGLAYNESNNIVLFYLDSNILHSFEHGHREKEGEKTIELAPILER